MKKSQHTKNKHQSVAALAFELSGSGSEVHLLPDGEFGTDDIRTQRFKLDSAIAAGVIARANARKRDTVIDYEHHTMMSDFAGFKAIAAGWFHDLEYRPGQGLYITDARWTDTAKAHIESGEYRYISAVFTYDADTGGIIRILHAGLTNDPALDGLAELELRAAAKYHLNQPEEDTPMNEEMLKLLGLAEDASEDDALAALKAKLAELNGKSQEVATLKRELDTKKGGVPDPAKYAPVEVVEELKTELAALKADQNEKSVEEIVSLAMKDGKLLKAQEKWARDLGKSDIAALKAYVDSAQPIAALKGSQTDGGTPPADGDITLTAEQKAICKGLGMSQDTYIAALKAEQKQAG